MKLEITPISGREQVEALSPQIKALNQFYRALNNRDMMLMSQNWLQSDEAVMDNPVGGVMRGWEEIRSVYERIFAGSGQFWFEFHNYSLHAQHETFYVVGQERGEYRAADGRPLRMAIRTSRIYKLVDGQWKQAHRHGSIDDPELLSAYQAAVRNPS